jgi:hypothetical protein
MIGMHIPLEVEIIMQIYSEQKSNSIHPHSSPPPSRGREKKAGTSFIL